MGRRLSFFLIEEKSLGRLNLWYRTVEKTAVLILWDGAFTIKGKFTLGHYTDKVVCILHVVREKGSMSGICLLFQMSIVEGMLESF